MSTRLVLRAGALTVVTAAAATALAGCGGGIGARLTYDDTEKVKVTEIVVSGNSGDVTVTASAIDETRIRRVVRSNGDDPDVSYRLTGTTLAIDTSCGHNCRASYEIEAPTGVAVRGGVHSGSLNLTGVASADVTVTSGDITLQGVTGQATAKATSGTITASALAGPATFHVTSGDIEASDLTGGGAIKVEANSGSVDLRLAQPASVTAHVTSGDIDLAVPDGSYRILHRTGSGDFESDVTSSPGATNVLDLRASSGNIAVTSS
ncbi:DUF4097 family beta strand repeat-containing protein [Nucisporomicrobium flavum]|jgi:Putative adhesin|uniref:DUF4097 family beta strand repeat-containing protein n=1 Tax=Nucisporomicrobium flavum TaxID=2785915 RepID=UPI0018F7A892|nr:DUF4097 family beta strand repeat-containing protein [Nucisporomicrobium flavum]